MTNPRAEPYEYWSDEAGNRHSAPSDEHGDYEFHYVRTDNPNYVVIPRDELVLQRDKFLAQVIFESKDSYRAVDAFIDQLLARSE